MLRALDHQVGLGLALLALKAQGHLLGGLGLLVEHRLRLATEAHLLVVVPALALSAQRSLTNLRDGIR